MKEISKEEYLKRIVDYKVLESDKHGDKVLLLPDEKICKLFRCKRTFSSAKYYPYAQRFADNAQKLKLLGVTSVEVNDVCSVRGMERDAVFYDMLEGETLRAVLKDKKDPLDLVEKFIKYLSELHKKGIYFRSLHFGNVIVRPEGTFGLIDVSDMKISSKPLGMLKRVRNFRAVLRYEEDKKVLMDYGVENFLNKYVSISKVSSGLFYTILKMQKKHPALKLLN